MYVFLVPEDEFDPAYCCFGRIKKVGNGKIIIKAEFLIAKIIEAMICLRNSANAVCVFKRTHF